MVCRVLLFEFLGARKKMHFITHKTTHFTNYFAPYLGQILHCKQRVKGFIGLKVDKIEFVRLFYKGTSGLFEQGIVF